MNKIIFANTEAGFPADEQFMRVVDEHRETIVQLCFALFGERNVILSGLEVSYTTKKENGITVHTTVVNEGVVWFNRDIRYVDRTELKGKVNIESIFLVPMVKTIKGTYHNGETHYTYSNNQVDIHTTPIPHFSTKLSDFVMFDTSFGALKSRSIEHWVKNYGNIKYSIKASEYMGLVNINGKIRLSEMTPFGSTVILTEPSKKYSFTGYDDTVLDFPCHASYFSEKYNKSFDKIAMFRVFSNGNTALTIPPEKALPDDTNLVITAYINASYIAL